MKTKHDIHKTGQDVLKAKAFPEGVGVCMESMHYQQVLLTGWMVTLASL